MSINYCLYPSISFLSFFQPTHIQSLPTTPTETALAKVTNNLHKLSLTIYPKCSFTSPVISVLPSLSFPSHVNAVYLVFRIPYTCGALPSYSSVSS